jgi:hypothetical protein
VIVHRDRSRYAVGFIWDVLDGREETHLGEQVDASPLQKHIVMRDHLHSISSCMGDERWRVVDQQLEELLLVVLDD